LAEVDGIVKFGDITEGKTMQEQLDEGPDFPEKLLWNFEEPICARAFPLRIEGKNRQDPRK